jgi:predicted DNA binding CopG/RHH family protein
MKKPPVKTNAKGEAIIPAFKDAREEAEWWDANSDFFMERLKKHGKLVQPASVPKTQSINLRISVDDIAKAKQIAQETGLGYQTVLKQAIREGLEKAGRIA